MLDSLEGDPLSQGDILEGARGNHDPWQQTLLVVTADCDLARSKHAGILTCVPLVPLHVYLFDFQLPKICSTLDERLIQETAAALGVRADSEFDDERTNISLERLGEWVVEASDDEILKALRVPELGTEKSRNLMAALRRIRAGVSNFQEACAAICHAKVALGDQSSFAKATASLKKQIQSSVRQLPGDAMYLSSSGRSTEDGFVAYLRRVHSVSMSEVAINIPEAQQGRPYVRQAKLASPFKYALTQQFGAVFSAIGLPEIYEKVRQEKTESLFEFSGEGTALWTG